MKKSELIFTAISVPFDYAVLILAGIVAYQIRYMEQIVEIRPVVFELQFREYLMALIVLAIFWLLVFAIAVAVSLVGAYLSIVSWKKLERMSHKDGGKLIGAKCFLKGSEITVTFELLYITAICYTTLLVFLILDRVFQSNSVIVFAFIAFFAIVTAMVLAAAFKTYFDIIRARK